MPTSIAMLIKSKRLKSAEENLKKARVKKRKLEVEGDFSSGTEEKGEVNVD